MLRQRETNATDPVGGQGSRVEDRDLQIDAVGTSQLIRVAVPDVNLHHCGMPRISTASSTEVLAGLVDRVTFHNAENGFCVLRVKARGQRDAITVIGHAAMISAGEFVQATYPHQAPYELQDEVQVFPWSGLAPCAFASASLPPSSIELAGGKHCQ